MFFWTAAPVAVRGPTKRRTLLDLDVQTGFKQEGRHEEDKNHVRGEKLGVARYLLDRNVEKINGKAHKNQGDGVGNLPPAGEQRNPGYRQQKQQKQFDDNCCRHGIGLRFHSTVSQAFLARLRRSMMVRPWI